MFRNYGVDKILRPVAVQKHEVNPSIPGWLNLYILGWRIYNKRINRVEIFLLHYIYHQTGGETLICHLKNPSKMLESSATTICHVPDRSRTVYNTILNLNLLLNIGVIWFIFAINISCFSAFVWIYGKCITFIMWPIRPIHDITNIRHTKSNNLARYAMCPLSFCIMRKNEFAIYTMIARFMGPTWGPA